MLKRMLLLSLIVGPPVVHGESVTDEKPARSLSCYKCFSKVSWEDCQDRLTEVKCPHHSNDVCIKTKIIKWVMKNGTQGQETVYSKHCDTTEGCSDKECTKLAWRCSSNCCNHDFCNSSVPMVARVSMVTSTIFMTYAIVACLTL